MELDAEAGGGAFETLVSPCQADDEEAIAYVDHGMLSLIFVDVEDDLEGYAVRR